MNMTYTEAKEFKADAEQACNAASEALIAAKGTGDALGLTPDSVKFSPEFQAAQAAYNAAFQRMRNVNAWFTKTYKKEYAAERKAKYASMVGA